MWVAKKLYIPRVSLARSVDATQCMQALELLPDDIALMQPLLGKLLMLREDLMGYVKKF